MVDHETPTERTASDEHDIRRRDILRATATTAAAATVGFGVVGTASAHEVEGKPVFCGCSQVCACGDGRADVLVAVEDGDGFTMHWMRNIDFDFCLSVDDPGVPDGKIIAVQVAGTRWINPGRCAEKALKAEQEQLDSTHPRPEGDFGGPCGVPPCEHPGRKDDRGRQNGSDNGRKNGSDNGRKNGNRGGNNHSSNGGPRR